MQEDLGGRKYLDIPVRPTVFWIIWYIPLWYYSLLLQRRHWFNLVCVAGLDIYIHANWGTNRWWGLFIQIRGFAANSERWNTAGMPKGWLIWGSECVLVNGEWMDTPWPACTAPLHEDVRKKKRRHRMVTWKPSQKLMRHPVAKRHVLGNTARWDRYGLFYRSWFWSLC